MPSLRSLPRSAAALSGLLALSLSSAASFEQAAEHLDLDGKLVGYVDFRGDGRELAAKLNLIYQEISAAAPEMPPIPVDFEALFENLGFGSLGSVAFSSKELESGLSANRWVANLNEAPSGLFGLYRLEGAEPTEFVAASLAPADASGAGNGPVNLVPLRETYRTLLSQFMGPMGEGIAQQHLDFAVPGTDLTVGELAEALSAQWVYAWKLELPEDASSEPHFTLWLRVDGAGKLVERLRPLEEAMGVAFAEDESGLSADFSALTVDADMGLILKSTPEGDLLAYTDPAWTDRSPGPRLADDANFQRLRAYLPETATWFHYNGGFDTERIFAELYENPLAAPYAGAIRSAFDLLVADFYAPHIAASTYEGEVLHGTQIAAYSTKQLVLLMPTMMTAGLGGAMAIPAFQKVRETSREKAVLNNLRQIASAADQYFLENGVTEVKVSELVGPNGYIRSLEPVGGESYLDLVISTDMDEISVTLDDGSVVSIPF